MLVQFLTYVHMWLTWRTTEAHQQHLSVKSTRLGLSLVSEQNISFPGQGTLVWPHQNVAAWSHSTDGHWTWKDCLMLKAFNFPPPQINSFGALWTVGKTVWAKEKGHFNQNTKYNFCELKSKVSNVCLWIQVCFFLFVWGSGWRIW